MSDPKTTSREQFQNDMLWVRGFTCFNVEGMQIHAKKKMQLKKIYTESFEWGLTSSCHKSLLPGISPGYYECGPWLLS